MSASSSARSGGSTRDRYAAGSASPPARSAAMNSRSSRSASAMPVTQYPRRARGAARAGSGTRSGARSPRSSPGTSAALSPLEHDQLHHPPVVVAQPGEHPVDRVLRLHDAALVRRLERRVRLQRPASFGRADARRWKSAIRRCGHRAQPDDELAHRRPGERRLDRADHDLARHVLHRRGRHLQRDAPLDVAPVAVHEDRQRGRRRRVGLRLGGAQVADQRVVREALELGFGEGAERGQPGSGRMGRNRT